jgi:uncharacterized membrane protein
MSGNLEGEFVIKNESQSEPKHSAHFYSNLVLNPNNVTFENQDTDEEIVLLVRRDLITNVPWIIFAIILILVPLLINSLSSFFTPFFNFSSGVQLIGFLFYYLIVFGYILIQFTLWYFNVGLVTTKRIVDFNVLGVLSKQISETKLNLVEDVTYSQVGSIRSVFDYGDVTIQTAGTQENFEFDRAPEPARIVHIIGDLIGGPR